MNRHQYRQQNFGYQQRRPNVQYQIQNMYSPTPAIARNPLISQLTYGRTFTEVDRSVVDILPRFPRCHINQDLTHMKCHYLSKSKAELDIALHTHVDIDTKSAGVCSAPVHKDTSKAEHTPNLKHIVRIMLLNGVPIDEDTSKPKIHFCQKLRFLVMKRELPPVGIQPIGGEWTLEDGKTPTDDSLKKTAIRCAKEITGLDLSLCLWTKIIEYWLRSENGTTTHVVYLLPNVWKVFPEGLKPCTQIREEVKEVTEEVDKEIVCEDDSSKTKTVKTKITTNKIDQVPLLCPTETSLSSLLEIPEHLAETGLSLFAHCFDEMLQRDFAIQLLSFLQKKLADRDLERDIAEEKKRKRLEEEASDAAKKLKTVSEDAIEKPDEEANQKINIETSPKEEVKPKIKTVHHVNQDILFPFQYFDRQNINNIVAGHISRDVIERVLHQLGNLTKSQVDSLLSAIDLPAPLKPTQPSPILYYIKLATTTTQMMEEEVKTIEMETSKIKEAKEEISVILASAPADEPVQKVTQHVVEVAETEESLGKLLVKDLRLLTGKRGLSSVGTKAEIIARLLRGTD